MAEKFDDFLNAKTSVTLGASAAMVIAFTTTLCMSFGWPSALVALVLSALFAGVQLSYSKDKIMAKLLFWVVCTLVIFHAARGGNITLSETEGPSNHPESIVVPSVSSEYSFELIQSAYAGGENKKDRYYFSKVNEDGASVYTNSAGQSYTNNSTKKVFQHWDWKSSK